MSMLGWSMPGDTPCILFDITKIDLLHYARDFRNVIKENVRSSFDAVAEVEGDGLLSSLNASFLRVDARLNLINLTHSKGWPLHLSNRSPTNFNPLSIKLSSQLSTDSRRSTEKNNSIFHRF